MRIPDLTIIEEMGVIRVEVELMIVECSG